MRGNSQGDFYFFAVLCKLENLKKKVWNMPKKLHFNLLRKFVLLIPLIYILPALLADKTMAVYTAEPVADVLAVTFTSILFAVQFRRALKGLAGPQGKITSNF